MVSADAIGSMFSGLGGWGAEILRWTGYTLISCFILGIGYAVYLFIQYKYKIDLRQVSGGKILPMKWERARVIRKKGIVKWKLLRSRKEIKPVPYKYIYPKRRIHLLRISETIFVPMEEQIGVETDKEKIILKPIDEDIDYWYQLQQQQIAQDYTPEGAAQKQMMVMFGGILLVLIFAGFVVWLAFTKTDALVTAIDSSSKSWMDAVTQKIVPN